MRLRTASEIKTNAPAGTSTNFGMDMNEYSIIFLAGLVIHTLIELWLLQRHSHSVRKHRASVPSAFQDKISLQSHQKAADYTLCKNRFEKLGTVVNVVILLGWTLGGGLQWLDQVWQSLAWNPIPLGVAIILSAFIISSLLNLPLRIYSTFVIEQGFGFNHSNIKLFCSDFIKETLLTLLLGVPLVWIILWLMESSGPYWWVWAWIVWIGFAILMQWAFPTLIAPLFNRFSPLEDIDLATKIRRLLERCGFTSSGVFIMDGSTRSSHGNAYFSGFGKQKRIVFYDTLLHSLNPDETHIETNAKHGCLITTGARVIGLASNPIRLFYWIRCGPAVKSYGFIVVCICCTCLVAVC